MKQNQLEILYRNAVAAYQKGDLTKAAARCRQLVKEQPRHPGVLQLAGVVALKENRNKKATDYLSAAAALLPQDPGLQINLALALTASGQRDEAISCYRRVIALAPDHGVAHYNLGQLLLLDNEPDEAAEILAKAASLQPQAAEIQIKLGIAWRQAGDLPPAICAFKEAVRLDDQDADTLALLANTLGEQDEAQFPEAISYYRQALAIAPKRAEIWSNLAWTLAETADYVAALEAAEMAIQHDPIFAPAHYHLGLIRFRLEELDTAEAALRQAITINPRYVRAYSTLALVLERQGDTSAVAAIAAPISYVEGFDISELVNVKNVQSFNDEFVEFIQAQPTLMFNRPNRSTSGGSQTLDLIGEQAPVMRKFRRAIDEAVRNYMARRCHDTANNYFAELPKKWRLSIWAVVLKAGGYQAPHNHPTGFISGVYYPKVPTVIGSAGEAGFIEFGPSNITGPDDQALVSEFRMAQQPVPGRMFLFPSYLWHRTIPYQSDEERVSVAFDILWRS